MNTVRSQGHFKEALQDLNPSTFFNLLQACSQKNSLAEGKLIHAHIYKRGLTAKKTLMNSLINMYVKCGSLMDARKVFDKMPQRDVCSWTAVIAAYSRHGLLDEAMTLFHQMTLAGVQPNEYTYATLLFTCASVASLGKGVEIHKGIISNGFEFDVAVATALVDMYGKCGSIEKARKLFDKMPQRDVITWNAMITGYAQNGHVDQALELFQTMPRRDSFSWTGMIAGFTKNGFIDEALKLFVQMPHRTVISWNAIIAGLAQNERGEEALQIFDHMQFSGVKPDSITFLSILPVCANLAALERCMQIHEKIIICGFQFDVPVMNALLDMYAKCGDIQNARQVFDKMSRLTVVSWSSMIAGYAIHGYAQEALRLFEEMRLGGIRPDYITFVSVLSACSRVGLVEEGCRYFSCMREYYKITPTMEHYRCMVDLLGRAGRLDEAWDFIRKMPIEPDAFLWICLLSACRVYQNVELAENVAPHIFELDPTNPAPYVLLSNIYAAAGRLRNFAEVRKMMRDKGLRKTPGCSWIEINKQVHAFVVGEGYPT